MSRAASRIDDDAAGGFRAARDLAFRKAKRHTAMVRVLRLLLPVTAVALLASYSLFVRQSYRISTAKGAEITFGSVSFSTEALKAYDPRYTGHNEDGSRYEVVAVSAEQDFRQTGPIKLDTINGKLFELNANVTRLKAVRGDFFDKEGRLELFERIDVDADNGLKARLSRATVHTKEQRITSDEPVTVDMPGTNVRGKRMVIEQKRKHVRFFDGVETRLTQDPAKPRPAARTDTNAGFVAGDGPIDIVSRQLAIDDAAKIALFSGDVVAKQGAATLTAPELEVFYENSAGASGDAAPVPAATAGAAQGNNRVRLIRAKHDVVMVNGTQRATGHNAEFDQRQDTVKLTGAVVITQEPDRKATADEALVDNKSDVTTLTGTVVVTQAKNVLRGRRMLVNRRAGTMHLASPPDATGGVGRVYARLYSADADRPAPAAPPKKAQAPAAGGPVFAPANRDEPIDVDAATLDVDDKAKSAIFRGAVVAVQGDYTIRTPELVAFYTGDSGFSLAAAPVQPTPGERKATSELRKIEARQRVAISTKDGRSATAQKAEFDPKSNMAVLTGDVTLTQDKAVTRGNRAVMDMTSGQFRMAEEMVGGGAAAARPAALFYPEQAKDAAKAAKDAAKGKPGGDSGAERKAPAPPPAPAPATRPKASSGWSAVEPSPVDRN